MVQLTLYRPDDRFEVLSNPEFLAEGTAVNDLLYPDRILIGSSMTPTGHAAAAALRSVYTAWVDPARVLTVNVWSSELAKLVANAMLAQRISSINTISAICDQTGADIDEISKAIGLDSRLGGGFLKAGLGFGGSCFKKDILSLTYLARSLHLPEVADYWMSVLSVNDFQRNRFTKKVVTALNGALVGKKITVLGYTFKQDTNDTRESPAIDVIKALLHERPREIAIFDPACTTSEIKKNIMALICTTHPDVVKPIGPVEAYDNAYEACKDSSAVLILTPWKQFRYPQPPLDSEIAVGNIVSPSSLLQDLSMRDMVEMDIMYLESRRRASLTMAERLALKDEADPLNRLVDRPVCGKECLLCQEGTKPAALKAHDNIDWAKVAGSMKEPKWVFDGRNIVDSDGMTELGFRVDNLGKRKSLMAQSRNSSVW